MTLMMTLLMMMMMMMMMLALEALLMTMTATHPSCYQRASHPVYSQVQIVGSLH
jgi:hypothetical protein